MKRIYTEPQMICINLDEQDVLTTSFTAQELAANDYTAGDYLPWA